MDAATPEFRVRRYAASTFCMALVAAGLYSFVCLLPDTRPLTAIENIYFYFSATVAWPFVVSGMFQRGSDPSLAVCILLSVASGLFWALWIEFFLMVKKTISG